MKYTFMRYPGGKAKAFTLSYDDGAKSDERMLEVFERYGLKCTFNLVASSLENGHGITPEFVKENILAKGHEVANHGYNHRSLRNVTPIQGIRDTLDSRLSLERIFGRIIRGMAFPDTSVYRSKLPDLYATVKNYLTDLDIAYTRNAGPDNDTMELPDDWHNWNPTAHHNNPKVFEYIDKFVELDVSKLYIAARRPKLLFIWGHSFEFDGRNNWDHLEEICKRISGKEDIWYATNMEIYEYTKAYESLVFSADESIVHNPTLLDIWFDVDGKQYMIKSGETINIANE